MTLERASEFVSALRKNFPCTKATDLFDHFVDVFNLESQEELEMFAMMCGYGVVRDVKIL